MLELTFPRHGAILNHNHGVEDENGLTVNFTGFCDVSGTISANGKTAVRIGRGFSLPVTLTGKFNTVEIKLHSMQGDFMQRVMVVWDKKSFPRYQFFIDDNSFFWSELIAKRPASLFDQFYLKALKGIHERVGTKFVLNLFYRNDHAQGPLLNEMPDIYKKEWEANSGWLRLAFHAYSEFPDRPYQDAAPETLRRDFELVHQEVLRFAGEKTWIAPSVIHWAMTTPENIRLLRSLGVKALNAAYLNADTGRALREAKESGENPFAFTADIPTCDIGFFMNLDEAEYLRTCKTFYHPDLDMVFTNDCATCNLVPLESIEKTVGSNMAENSGNETFTLLTHEQYCYPFYQVYEPDHFERIERAARFLTERGAKPVFFSEGLLGNTAWEK